MATVCKYFKFGYCKYQNSCRFKHVDTICDNLRCEIVSCEKRHPKDCKYFREFGRCKFSPCSFKHVNVRAEQEKKIDHLEKSLPRKKQIFPFISRADRSHFLKICILYCHITVDFIPIHSEYNFALFLKCKG